MANQATITANKELVREFIDRVFNERNAKATQDYFSPDVTLLAYLVSCGELVLDPLEVAGPGAV